MMDTQKGKPLVLCNGFLMAKHIKSSDGLRQFWRCQMHHKGCHGRAVSALGSTTLKETATHDIHVASPAEIKTRHAITKAKRMAVASYGMPSKSILDAAKSELSEGEIQAFPKDEKIKRIITNARKPIRENNVDKPLNQMVLSEEFRTTTTGNRFLLCDSRENEPDKPVFLIFASDRGLDFLRIYRNWSIDGTFFSCPKNFGQLFTINVFKDESTLPAVFMLLPNKEGETYTRAFEALFFHIPGIQPDSVMSDFEKAPTIALTNLFPNINYKYCLFHLSQNMFRNVQKKGLFDIYQIADIKLLLRSLTALAFLPVNEVELGFDEIVTALEAKIAEHAIPIEKAQALRENTYIRRVVGRNTLSPLFPIEFWNCFNSVLDNQARTNNAIEGWHRVFNKKFSKRNLNLSHFIIKLKEEEHTTWQLALRHAANPADPLRNPRSTKVANSEKQISKLVNNFVEVDRADRQRLPYLRSLQFHLAKFYTPAADDNPENEGNDESQEEEE